MDGHRLGEALQCEWLERLEACLPAGAARGLVVRDQATVRRLHQPCGEVDRLTDHRVEAARAGRYLAGVQQTGGESDAGAKSRRAQRLPQLQRGERCALRIVFVAPSRQAEDHYEAEALVVGSQAQEDPLVSIDRALDGHHELLEPLACVGRSVVDLTEASEDRAHRPELRHPLDLAGLDPLYHRSNHVPPHTRLGLRWQGRGPKRLRGERVQRRHQPDDPPALPHDGQRSKILGRLWRDDHLPRRRRSVARRQLAHRHTVGQHEPATADPAEIQHAQRADADAGLDRQPDIPTSLEPVQLVPDRKRALSRQPSAARPFVVRPASE